MDGRFNSKRFLVGYFFDFITTYFKAKIIAVSSKQGFLIKKYKQYFQIALVVFTFLTSHSLLANIGQEIAQDAISPVTNSDAEKVLIIGASTTLIASFFKTTLIKNFQSHISRTKPLGNLTKPGNKYLQILPNILYSLSYGLDFYLSKDDDSKRRAIGMAKATIYSGLVTDVLKRVVNEERPNGGKLSFPSGHTTTAFAFASFVASEHPWYIGVPAYVMASYVGLCRIQDNFHFLHDVMAGATIGISYGIALSQKSKTDQEVKSALIVLPTEELKGLAIKYAITY